MAYNKPKYAGFTLIEILVVVGLIAILAAVTIVAINPAKNFEQTRDAQRSSDVGVILNAITQYTSEDGNTLAGMVSATGFGSTATGGPFTMAVCGVGVDKIMNNIDTVAPITPFLPADLALGIDLETVLVDEYVVSIPTDPNGTAPLGTTGLDTGYTVCRTAGGRVTVAATPERATSISVSR